MLKCRLLYFVDKITNEFNTGGGNELRHYSVFAYPCSFKPAYLSTDPSFVGMTGKSQSGIAGNKDSRWIWLPVVTFYSSKSTSSLSTVSLTITGCDHAFPFITAAANAML
jgi:hypothetical protein